MFKKILYEKQFPKDPILEELEKQKSADEFNAFHARFSSLTEMLDHVEQNTLCTPLRYKMRNRKKFINAAIEISEAYEMDLEIIQHKGSVCADFLLSNGTSFRKLNNLMALGDEFYFGTRSDGNKVVFSITYFTHRQERNGLVIAP